MCPLPPPQKKNKHRHLLSGWTARKLQNAPSRRTPNRPSPRQTPTMKGLCYKGEEWPMRTCCFFGDDILPSMIEIKIGHYNKDSYEPISISYNGISPMMVLIVILDNTSSFLNLSPLTYPSSPEIASLMSPLRLHHSFPLKKVLGFPSVHHLVR